ncbi:MAG: GFA family protein [Hyphomicrobiaceae bacterium]
MSSYKGSCLCGAVTYEATGSPHISLQCHCLDCQKASGAAHIAFAAFAATDVTIQGTLKSFTTRADSGKPSERLFCPECGSWIAGRPASAPGLIALTMATMEDSSDIPIQLRVYDKRRRSWDVVDPGIPAFPAMPPM